MDGGRRKRREWERREEKEIGKTVEGRRSKGERRVK